MSTFNAEKTRKRNNIIIMAISFFIMAMVVISVVVVLDKPSVDQQEPNNDNNNHTIIATLDTLCGFTDYRNVCQATLAPTVGYQSQVENYFQAAVNATLVEMRNVVEIPKRYIDNTTNHMEMYALEDCIQVLDLCIDELEYVMATQPLEALLNNSDDVRNSLSAVVAYQQACLEGLVYANSSSNFQEDLKLSIELASNALAIEFNYSENDDKDDEDDEAVQKNRRLLSVTSKEGNFNDVGYPTWLTAADRRLLQVDVDVLAPHAVVAQDGTGQFEKIADAVKAYPKNHTGRYIIYVKSGEYRETITITKEKINVFMYGDGATETVVIGRRKNTTVYRSATFSAIGKGFICKHMGFTSAGYRPDKVALRVQSDQAAFFNCAIDGTIGPLLALAHRQFFRHCKISGTLNIITGDSALVIQNSWIIVKKPVLTRKATVTANGRSDRHENTGFVLHNCAVVPDEKFKPERFNYSTYLGVALNKYARTIVMESELGDFIHPEGWLTGDEDIGAYTVNFAEYKNNGPGAQTSKRVNWPGYKEITDENKAMHYAPDRFIQIEEWLKMDVEIPYHAGLYN
ncbi:pectinesterase [Ziziphus jujuba]|uniref:Pectinesterase n=1 Tax=Ziziphus jujuba TaxID=326968 RepID=A0A6P6FUX8_ZIZJJ|nr:pectinesterase [Ziziphus jujuba]